MQLNYNLVKLLTYLKDIKIKVGFAFVNTFALLSCLFQ